jgi:hypothetical protein
LAADTRSLGLNVSILDMRSLAMGSHSSPGTFCSNGTGRRPRNEPRESGESDGHSSGFGVPITLRIKRK